MYSLYPCPAAQLSIASPLAAASVFARRFCTPSGAGGGLRMLHGASRAPRLPLAWPLADPPPAATSRNPLKRLSRAQPTRPHGGPGHAPHRHCQPVGRSPKLHLTPTCLKLHLTPTGPKLRLATTQRAMPPRSTPNTYKCAWCACAWVRHTKEVVGHTLTSQLNTLAMLTSVTVIWSRRWPMSSTRVTRAAFAFFRLSSSNRIASSRGYSSMTLAPSHRHT